MPHRGRDIMRTMLFGTSFEFLAGFLLLCMAIMEPQLDSAVTGGMQTSLCAYQGGPMVSFICFKMYFCGNGTCNIFSVCLKSNFLSELASFCPVAHESRADVPSAWPKSQRNKSFVLSVKRSSIQLTMCIFCIAIQYIKLNKLTYFNRLI